MERRFRQPPLAAPKCDACCGSDRQPQHDFALSTMWANLRPARRSDRGAGGERPAAVRYHEDHPGVRQPDKNPKFQPGATTVWDSKKKAYQFRGTMPNVGGLLPVNFDTPSCPGRRIGKPFGAGVYVEGWLFQDGRLWFGALNAEAYARLMSIDVYQQDVEPGPGRHWPKGSGRRIWPRSRHQTPRFSWPRFGKS